MPTVLRPRPEQALAVSSSAAVPTVMLIRRLWDMGSVLVCAVVTVLVHSLTRRGAGGLRCSADRMNVRTPYRLRASSALFIQAVTEFLSGET
ncbi:hypothetical protein GCM10010343_09560 [Streptomyces avidinii]|nr:hypothetical protein GCM10010343_09560 [Streptomyces avidinii]